MIQSAMKNELFARPNLKGFVAAALIIVALRQFIISGDADESHWPIDISTQAMPQDAEVDRLIQRALANPSSVNFTLISDCYRKRGDTRKALHYLRKAQLAARWEDESP